LMTEMLRPVRNGRQSYIPHTEIIIRVIPPDRIYPPSSLLKFQ
jgi:hypothetical protein